MKSISFKVFSSPARAMALLDHSSGFSKARRAKEPMSATETSCKRWLPPNQDAQVAPKILIRVLDDCGEHQKDYSLAVEVSCECGLSDSSKSSWIGASLREMLREATYQQMSQLAKEFYSLLHEAYRPQEADPSTQLACRQYTNARRTSTAIAYS